MKKVKTITCWTDYPIETLGDKPGEKAPIRRVRVDSYDGNKYVEVTVLGADVQYSFKAGYLYSKPGRLGEVPRVNIRKIERMGDGKRARQADQFRKDWERREKRDKERERVAFAFMRRRGMAWAQAWDEALTVA